MKRLWNSLLRRTSHCSNSRRRATLRPRIEGLEERRLMAADIRIVEMEIDGEEFDVLEIRGTENRDRIEIAFLDRDSPQDGIVATVRDPANNNILIQRSYNEDELDDFEAIYVYALGGDDSVNNFVNIPSWQEGGAGKDGLGGGTENDVLIGGTEDDGYFFGTYNQEGEDLGHDTIVEVGNSAYDKLSFQNFDWGITLDLASAEEQIVSPGHLRLTLTSPRNLEDVMGTLYDDVLWGNAVANSLQGFDGNDVLEGRGGNDELRGGDGDDTYVFAGSANLGTDIVGSESPAEDTDTLDFSGFLRPITLDIGWTTPQTAQVVSSGYLSLKLAGYEGTGLENVIGTELADTIFGNSRDNEIFGRDGNDKIYGRAGNDTLDGGGLHDNLFGEAGFDILYGQGGRDFLDGGFDGLADELWGGDDADYLILYYELYTDVLSRRQYVIPRLNEQAFMDFDASEGDLKIVQFQPTYGAGPRW